LENLEAQIRLTTYGVEKPIADMQTATGTKDKVAQYWIDILIKKACEMKSQQPGQSSEAIAEELQWWLILQPGDKVNPLLSVAGVFCCPFALILGCDRYFWQVSIPPKIHLLRYCIPSCSESSNMSGTCFTPHGLRLIIIFLPFASNPRISMVSQYPLFVQHT
jgi:hypothetical protein